MQIVTKDKQIRAFIEKIVEYALTSDEEQIGMLLKDQAKNQSIIDYLFMNFPALAPIFIKQIKKTLNENNVLSVEQSISKQQSLIRTAAKEWINE